jgi:hypothetical protein
MALSERGRPRPPDEDAVQYSTEYCNYDSFQTAFAKANQATRAPIRCARLDRSEMRPARHQFEIKTFLWFKPQLGCFHESQACLFTW